MEEVMFVNMFKTRQNLEEDALHTGPIQRLMVARFHELVEVAIHVFHGDVKFSAQWIQEDVESWHQMRVIGQRLQEDDFSKFHALREVVESLLHRLDGNLETVNKRVK
jgi:hypothetical protein